MEKIGVEIWGAGPIGNELAGILSGHPNVGNIERLGRDSDTLETTEAVFIATPHGTAGPIAERALKSGKAVFDLSADLRFADAQEYENWYDEENPSPDLLPVTYGLAEINKEEIRGKNIVSIPGCYPTATLLGTLPLLQHGIVKPESRIIVDAYSGYSGQGKGAEQQDDDIELYNVGRQHRHVGEMEQLTRGHQIIFSPGVLKHTERGILSVIKMQLADRKQATDVQWFIEGTYAGEPFIEVLPAGMLPNQQKAANTDLCVIGTHVEEDIAIVVSAVDNLRKGAASQAVQCFNIALGFDETAGLTPKSEVF